MIRNSGPSQLHGEPEVSLGYLRSHLKGTDCHYVSQTGFPPKILVPQALRPGIPGADAHQAESVCEPQVNVPLSEAFTGSAAAGTSVRLGWVSAGSIPLPWILCSYFIRLHFKCYPLPGYPSKCPSPTVLSS